eukprot:4565806-Prymnesium_polylepis.2
MLGGHATRLRALQRDGRRPEGEAGRVEGLELEVRDGHAVAHRARTGLILDLDGEARLAGVARAEERGGRRRLVLREVVGDVENELPRAVDGPIELDAVDERDRELVKRDEDAALELVALLIARVDRVLAPGVWDGRARARVRRERARPLRERGLPAAIGLVLVVQATRPVDAVVGDLDGDGGIGPTTLGEGRRAAELGRRDVRGGGDLVAVEAALRRDVIRRLPLQD